MEFTKIIHPCDCPVGNRKYPMFCKINLLEGKLSISGVVGPNTHGNAMGGCGQIDMEFDHKDKTHNDKRYSNLIKPSELRFSKGWNIDKWYKFLEIWHTWHLNDLKAGCEHQRALGWEEEGYDKHPSEPCPTCGYKYGSAWHKVEIPNNVINFLKELPNTDRKPNWI
jgi:hypothetical protein